MKKNKGIASIEIIVGTVVAVLIVAAGLFVWQNREENKEKLDNSSNQEIVESTASLTKPLTLADNSVSFSIPENWSKSTENGCSEGAPIFGDEKLLDSIELVADDGANQSEDPYFNVDICVFNNPTVQDAPEWANSTDGGASIGYPSENDEESFESINGYSTYYSKFTAEEHSGLEDVYYVLATNDKIVYVNSRLIEKFEKFPGEDDESSMAPIDFTQYEPTIRDIVNSLSIN